MEEFVLFLKRQVEGKKKKNPKFSLRSFAKSIGVSAGNLSDIFSGKRKLSLVQAEKIATKLKLRPSDRKDFGLRTDSKIKSFEDFESSEDLTTLFLHWWTLAILNLPQIRGSKPDSAWIANYLAIGEAEAKDSLKLLTRLKLIEIKGSGWKRIKRPLRFSKNKAIKDANLKMIDIDMDRMRTAYKKVNDLGRGSTCLFFPADRKKIDYINYLIQTFVQEQLLPEVSSHRPNSLYRAVFHVFPYATKKIGRKN